MAAPRTFNESQLTTALARVSIADDPVTEKLKYQRTEYQYYLGKSLLINNMRWRSAYPHNILMPSPRLFNPALPPEVQEVQLAVIGQVSADGFWFTTTGRIKPSASDSVQLVNEKSTFILRCPDENILDEYPGLKRDWENVRRNVDVIQRESKSGDVDHLHFWVRRGRYEGIRISHQLFEPVNNENRTENPNDGFNTATWPIPATDPAKRKLEDLIRAATHVVRVPEIYGMDNELVHPTQYANQLPNAIVQCYFEVAHIVMPRRGNEGPKAVFTPRLVQMSVLRPRMSVDSARKVRKDFGADHKGTPTKGWRS